MQMKALRKKCGYTQKEAADKFGISLRTYISYENDESKSTSMKYRYMINELENLSHMDEEHGVLSVDEIRKICDDVFKNYDVKYCYLFGSYAKGNATQSSDVDLLISTNVTGLKYYEMVESLRDNLHKKIDLLDLKQLSNNNELLDEVLSDGVKIYG